MKLLNISEAARHCGVANSRIYQLLRTGRLVRIEHNGQRGIDEATLAPFVRNTATTSRMLADLIGDALTVAQVAERIGVRPQAIAHQIARGHIKARAVQAPKGTRKIMVVDQAELDRFMTEVVNVEVQ